MQSPGHFLQHAAVFSFQCWIPMFFLLANTDSNPSIAVSSLYNLFQHVRIISLDDILWSKISHKKITILYLHLRS